MTERENPVLAHHKNQSYCTRCGRDREAASGLLVCAPGLETACRRAHIG